MNMPGGGGIAQLLQSFISNPQAQAVMQDPQLQKMGMQAMQTPGAMQKALQGIMQMVGGGGGPDPRAMMAQQAPGVPDSGMPANAGGEEFPPMGEAQGQMQTTEDEMAMVQGQLEPGYEFQGTKAPTQDDIEYLRQNPTDAVVEEFEARFGEGSTGMYLNTDEGDIEEGVEAEEDPGDHEYR